MIYTFYSYKGGVGRSMALSAVARALAFRGLKVLVVDFDLEAPGIERYFHGPEDSRQRRREPGLVDLIAKYREALTDEAAFGRAEFQQLDRYQLPAIHTAGTRGGAVDLLSAGCREPIERLREYSQVVRNFDWQDFFYNWKGDRFFEWLRRRWLEPGKGYDVVLVDSRTGVTEMGGVCAYQLADVMVMLSAPNSQNLEGTRDVARDFTSASVLALRQGRPLQTLAVPARLAGAHPRRAAFLTDFEREMGVLGMPRVLADAGLNYERLAISFDSELSVGEMAVGDPVQPAAPPSAFGEDIDRLASALLLLATDTGPLAAARQEALALLTGGDNATVSPAQPLQSNSARASAGYDVFVDHGRDERASARALVGELETRGLVCFFDETELAAGDDWVQRVRVALSYSANLLVLLSGSVLSTRRHDLLRLARRQAQLRIVPVLLSGASAQATADAGLDDLVAADFRSGMNGPEIDSLVGRLSATTADAGAAGDVVGHSPFPGPRPYAESDARHFRGREDEVRELSRALAQHPVVVLEGPGQCGKSSLVASGLVPWLRGGNTAIGLSSVQIIEATDSRWRTPRKRRGGARLAALALVVLDHADTTVDSTDSPDAHSLENRCERIAELRARAGTDFRILIVRRGVAKRLCRDDDPEGTVVVELKPMAAEILRRALEEAARSAGQLLEPGLAERVVEGVGPARSSLTQVQRLMQQLWQERRRGWLTNQGLQSLGYAGGAFARSLNEFLADRPEGWRQSLECVLLATVSMGPEQHLHPLPRPWAELATLGIFDAPAAVPAVAWRDTMATLAFVDIWVDRTAGVMLAPVRPDGRDYLGGTLGDEPAGFLGWRVSHQGLLAGWLAQGRRDSELLSAQALIDARGWLARRPEWLLGDERSLIEASVQRHVLQLSPPSLNAEPSSTIEAVSGQDAVQLELQDGATLLLHPETARELLTGTESNRSGTGWWSLLKTLRVLGVETPGTTGNAAEQIAQTEGKTRLVAVVGTPGGRAELPPLPAASLQTWLVLVHGTLFDSGITFGPLWHRHPALAGTLALHYGGRIVALEQATLTADPVANALVLASAVPAGARLHLLTHGAGGLVGEVMVRAGAATLDELQALRSPALAGLLPLAKTLHERELRVERMVRIACPARGQTYARGRLDAWLSTLLWSCEAAGGQSTATFKRLVQQAVRDRLQPAMLPGLAACLPDSELLRWLPSVAEPVASELRVVAGLSGQTSGLGSWLTTLLAETFYQTESDLVVTTRSMYGGVPRVGGAKFYLHQTPGTDLHHFGYLLDDACAQAVVGALVLDEPSGFHPVGPLSWAGDSHMGSR